MAAGWSCQLRKAFPFSIRLRNSLPLVTARSLYKGTSVGQQQKVAEADSEGRAKSASESGQFTAGLERDDW